MEAVIRDSAAHREGERPWPHRSLTTVHQNEYNNNGKVERLCDLPKRGTEMPVGRGCLWDVLRPSVCEGAAATYNKAKCEKANRARVEVEARCSVPSFEMLNYDAK